MRTRHHARPVHRRRRLGLILSLTSLMLATNLSGIAFAKEGGSLAQCANGKQGTPRAACDTTWVNGNLNKNNSQYAEGDGVAFRRLFTGMEVGDTYIYTIGWDTVEGTAIAYDHLVSWDHTETGDPGHGTSFEDVASTSTFAIPVDPRISNEGVTLPAGQIEAWGFTITNVGNYQYSSGTATDPLPNSTMQTSVDVTFTVTSPNGIIAWGGHIATTLDWGPAGRTTAAHEITGSPYHMRNVGLFNVTDDEDINIGSQDRSLSAGAVAPVASLTIDKAASASDVAPGGSFSYTVTVTNTGDADATSVAVSDTVDPAFSVTAVAPSQGSCDPPSNSVSCALGTIGPGGSATVTVTVSVPSTPDSCQTVGNVASVVADDVEAIESNNVDVTITGCTTDLSLTKTNDTNDTAGPGESWNWTLTAANDAAATATATDVQITDAIPGGLSVSSIAPDPGVDCSASNGNLVDCTIESLAPGESASVVVTVAAPQVDGCASYANTGVLLDNDQALGTANDTVVVSGCAPDLDIDKLNDTAGVAQLGATFHWTLRVTNDQAATGTATDLQVTDTVPAGLTVLDVTAPDSVNCDNSSGNVVDCTIATLAPGATVDIEVEVAASQAGPCGDFENTGVLLDNQQPVASDDDTVTVDGCSSDLTLTKSNDTNGVAAPGDTFQWTVTVTNDQGATSDATSLDVTDTLPAGLDYTDLVLDPGDDCQLNQQAGTVECHIDSLAPGESMDFVLTVAVPPSDSCGVYQNGVVLLDGQEPLLAANDNVTVVGCTPDLSITKTNDTAGAAAPGETFDWTLTVTNGAGATATATNLAVSDLVPAGLQVTSVTADNGVNCGNGFGNDVFCTIEQLAPGASVDVVVTVEVPEVDSCEVWENTGDLFQGESLVASDEDAVTVAGCAPDVSIDKSASSDSVGLGGSITWTLVATNADSANADALNVVINDTVPSPLAVTEVTSDDADCSASLGNNVTCDVGTLAPGESATVTVTGAAPSEGPVCASYPNTGVVVVNGQVADSDDVDVTVTGCVSAIDLVKTADLDEVDGVKSALHDPLDGDDETIVYFYDITNTGTETLTDIALGDDVLGALLTSTDGVSLAPGESITVMAKHILTAADVEAGEVVNVATASGLDGSQQQVTDTDQETVVVTGLEGGVEEVAETGAEVVPLLGISNVLMAVGAALTKLVPRSGRGSRTRGGTMAGALRPAVVTTRAHQRGGSRRN